MFFRSRLLRTILPALLLMFGAAQAQWVQTSCPGAQKILCLAASGTAIFAGTNGSGIAKSSDNGTTWASSNAGLPANSIINTIVQSGSYLLVGTAGWGVYVSGDNGSSWLPASVGLGSSATVTALQTSGTTLFAGTFGNGVFSSADNGANWSPSSSGLPAGTIVGALTNSNGTLVLSTPAGLYRSANNGLSWTAYSAGPLSAAPASALAANSAEVYAGTSGNGMYRSVDNGASWAACDSGLPSGKSALSLLGKAPDMFGGFDGSVYHFTGNVWSPVNSGLSTGCTVLSLATYGNYLYAGTNTGVWKSILPPVSPSSFFPADHATNLGDSLLFSWNASTNAVTYTLQVSTDPTFTTSVAYSKSGITATSQMVAGFSRNTAYSWRVSSSNAGGTSAWSTPCTFTTTLLIPTQTAPANNALNQASSLTLSWNSVASATRYGLQVASDSTFASSLAFSSSTLEASTQAISGLTPNTQYWWRVNAGNAGGIGAWSGTYAFKTMVAVPECPLLTLPANGSTGQVLSPVLNWNAIASASSYALQVSTDSTFASAIILSQSGISATSLAVSGLENSTSYWWRVQATNIAGTGAWSSPSHFTTILQIPTLLSPAANTTGQSCAPTLRWNAVSKASSYALQVSTDASFNNAAAHIFNHVGITAVTQELSGLANNTSYWWRVNATNAGGTSAWSAGSKFTTIIAIPDAPVPSSPLNNALSQALSPNLAWNSTPNASTYTLQVATDSSFASSITFSQSAIATASQTVSGLLNSTRYFWRVNAANNAGTGPWSNTYTFTTIIASPALSAPAQGAVNQTSAPTLVWDAVAAAESYTLQVSTDSSFSSAAASAVNHSALTDLSESISGLANSRKYFWRVNATNTEGTGAWSAIRSFTTIAAIPPAPLCISPLNNALSQAMSLSLSWSAAATASSYALQVSTDSSFASSLILSQSGIVILSQALSGLSAGTTYWWRVNAVNTAGTGPWSEPFRFSTLLPSPGTVYPENGAAARPLSLSIVWNSVPDAASYMLQVGTDSLLSGTPLFSRSGLNDTTQLITGLLNNAKYWWHVKSISSSGSSAWSASCRFYTLLSSPVLQSPANGVAEQSVTPKLSWTAVSTATSYSMQISADSLFSSSSPVYTQSGITTAFVTCSSLQGSTKYWWRVIASNTAGTGQWSAPLCFSTLLPAPAPALPANLAISQPTTAIIAWSGYAGSASYTLQVSSDASFLNTVYKDSAITASADTISGLACAATYYWRIKASGSSATSAWSTAWRFTTVIAAPASPAPVSPLTNATNQSTSPKLMWNTGAGAASYSLEVSTDSTFSAASVFNQSGISTNYQSISGLGSGIRYYWRLRAANAGGSSAWSTIHSFTTLGATSTLPAPPLPVAPINTAQSQALSLIFLWKASTGASFYNLQVSADSTFASSPLCNQSGLTVLSHTLGGLANNTCYYWRVNAGNASGTGAWSTISRFTTILAAPEALVPARAAIGQALMLSLQWTLVPTATSYAVQVSTDSLFKTILGGQSGLALPSWIMGNLKNATRYWWRTNATNSLGTSSWSTPVPFTTILPPPVPALPANNSGDVSTALKFTWVAVPGADSYSIQVSEDPEFNGENTYFRSDITVTYQALTDLLEGRVYWWRLNATNAGGTSDWSAAQIFETSPGAATKIIDSAEAPYSSNLRRGIYAMNNPVSSHEGKIALLVCAGCEAEVHVRIFDPLGTMVDEQTETVETEGQRILYWDLCHEGGRPVAAGSFCAVAQVRDRSGSLATYKTMIIVRP